MLLVGFARTIYIWCTYNFFARISSNMRSYTVRCMYMVLANPICWLSATFLHNGRGVSVFGNSAWQKHTRTPDTSIRIRNLPSSFLCLIFTQLNDKHCICCRLLQHILIVLLAGMLTHHLCNRQSCTTQCDLCMYAA